ncbi:MAG: hypothetical protein N2383_02865 [Caldilineales bacterium]|nr:hypothetical protein [Caldilineales bacterium]
MSRQLALMLTTALTVFVLGIGAALAWQIQNRPASADATSIEADPLPPVMVESQPVTTTAPMMATAPLTDPEREALYRQRIEEANQRLLQLQAQVEQLRAQNAQLSQREHIYQQRLDEANRLLQQLSTTNSLAQGGLPGGQAGEIRPIWPGLTNSGRSEAYEVLEHLFHTDQDAHEEHDAED